MSSRHMSVDPLFHQNKKDGIGQAIRNFKKGISESEEIEAPKESPKKDSSKKEETQKKESE
jgi:hypothetical protein